MNNLSVIIPYFNGGATIEALLAAIPDTLPVVVVDDLSDVPFASQRPNVNVIRLDMKGYFAGAVNAGISVTRTDVLILNQDVTLTGTEWLKLLDENRGEYAMIGERIAGEHPAFPKGYIHGTFCFLRRDAIERVGLLNGVDFPLWGNTAEWQWRAARKGYKILPLTTVPDFVHLREKGKAYGSSIRSLLVTESQRQELLIRTPPLVSVVIPCYNHGRYLADAVHSLIGGPTCLGEHPGQTLQAFEIIIVDDGSSDDSGVIADSLADEWKGIKVIHQRNQGTPAAHNTGIRAAVGKYITTMSADDMREPWGLETLYRACVANPKMVTYDDIRIVVDGERRNLWKMPRYDFEIMIQKNQMHVGIMFPREAWEDVGGYPEVMREGREDWAFNVALGRRGWCGLHVEGEPGYLYRRHDTNRTLRNTSEDWRLFFRVKLEKLYPDIYGGKRPMGCCGGGGNSRNVASNGPSARGIVPSGPAGSAGMTLLEYRGDSAGTVIWGGQGAVPTGQRYTFGMAERHKIKWVDNRDVPWFLGLREKEKNLFRIYQTVVVEAAKPVIVKSEEQKSEDPIVVIDTSDGINDGEASAAGQVLSQRRKEGEAGEEFDPASLTVAQIKELAGKLTKEEWAELLEIEEANKNRMSALAFIHAQMDA